MKAIVNANVVLPGEIIPDGCLLFENGMILASGRIRPPEGVECIDAGGLYAGPGLVDQHVHGYHWGCETFGVSDSCEAMAAAHLKHGTTAITPSAAYNHSYDAFTSVIRQCNAAVERGDTTIVGVHCEGPYTNPNYGSLSKLAWTYSRERCEELLRLGGKNIRHWTYAPELPCAPEIEELLTRYGVTGDIGHTCAGPADMERAVAHGARIVTHLFDAMGHWQGPAKAAEATGDVQSSVAVIALTMPELYCELICDSMGAHVSRYNARLALRAAGEDRIVLITDASVESGVGGPPADSAYAAATDLNFDVNGQLSGSFLTLNRACANFMRMTGADIRVAFKCASTNPAKALGIFDRAGSLEPGKRADIVLVDGEFNVRSVYLRGEPIPEVRN